MCRAYQLNREGDVITSGKYDLNAGYWHTDNTSHAYDGEHWIITPDDALYEGR